MRRRSFVLGLAAGAYAAAVLTVSLAGVASPQEGKTTRDGVYTAAQAARGKELFEKVCSKCHVFAVDPSVPKLEGPPLGGATFFNNWEDKTIFALATSIRLGMPPDGSVTVDAQQAADVIAFILQSNTLPAGESELTADASARNIKIARPGDAVR
jgi:cytochrome c5